MSERRLICKNQLCPSHVTGDDRLPTTFPIGSPLHCECGGRLEIEIFPLRPSWVGPISAKYLDRSKEGGNKVDGGHWAFEKESKPGTQSKATYIETWQDQREFCKRNGLALPSEMGNNHAVAEDGKTVLNTCGMPGTEV